MAPVDCSKALTGYLLAARGSATNPESLTGCLLPAQGSGTNLERFTGYQLLPEVLVEPT